MEETKIAAFLFDSFSLWSYSKDYQDQDLGREWTLSIA
jgi:hypothetical protein